MPEVLQVSCTQGVNWWYIRRSEDLFFVLPAHFIMTYSVSSEIFCIFKIHLLLLLLLRYFNLNHVSRPRLAIQADNAYSKNKPRLLKTCMRHGHRTANLHNDNKSNNAKQSPWLYLQSELSECASFATISLLPFPVFMENLLPYFLVDKDMIGLFYPTQLDFSVFPCLS